MQTTSDDSTFVTLKYGKVERTWEFWITMPEEVLHIYHQKLIAMYGQTYNNPSTEVFCKIMLGAIIEYENRS